MYLLCDDIFLKSLKICQGRREDAHFHWRRIIQIRSRLMQVSFALLCCRVPRCFEGEKSALSGRSRSFTFDRDNYSCQATEMQLPLCENVSF